MAWAVKRLVKSTDASLCHESKRKRLKLSEVHGALVALLLNSGKEAASPISPVAPAASAVPLGQTALSVQVRGMRRGDDAHERLQRNVSNGFDAAMRRLEVVFAASRSAAPTDGFESLINYWFKCGMHERLRKDLHTLRIWRNASDHHDSDRWQREGPQGDAEASIILLRITEAIDLLEAV